MGPAISRVCGAEECGERKNGALGDGEVPPPPKPPLAGGLLALTAVWITVAGALVADTWRINNERAPEPLFPYKRKGRVSQTRFWFED